MWHQFGILKVRSWLLYLELGMYILFKDEFPIDKVMIIDLISIIHVIFWSLPILGGGGVKTSQTGSKRLAFICSKRTWLCVPTQPQMCGYCWNRVKICLNTRSQCLNINLLSSRPNRALQMYIMWTSLIFRRITCSKLCVDLVM